MNSKSFSERLLSSKLPVILLAVIISMLLGAILISISGGSAPAAYRQLFLTPFTTHSATGDMLSTITPLLIIAIGVSVAQHGGLTNLGGNGQVVMGGIAMALVATSPAAEALGPLIWIPGFLCAFLFGALWGMIAGAFKAYIHSSEIIVSLLLNYIAAQIISYLLRGPMMAQGVTVPESELVPEAAHMPTLMANTSANAGIFFAFGLLVIYGVFMYKTRTGYKIRTLGYSEKAAKYGGVEKSKYDVLLMAVSGGIVGLAGGMEVLGGQYRLVEGIANNMGFTGVVVALVGLLQPVGIALAAVFMAVLTVGSKYMQIMSKVPVALKDVLEALMVLFILWGFSLNLKRRRIKEGN